jgi:serine/threonine protein kinase
LDSTSSRDSCLAPGYFGTRSIAGHPDVPYLVMPFYPSGSVKEYLARRRGQLTLDWCLRVSEQMFRACAQLGEKHIVSCDAKLSNFVFARGAYSPALTSEDELAINPALHLDVAGEPPDPVVRMIDLSMVYERGQSEERPTRGTRGTEYWSSPRAMSGIKDELPYELTNLDDAFTIAINSIYLLTEQEPPYPTGMRVALEVLGGGDLRQEAPLIELSEMLMRLADRREMGHRAEDMLVAGREWLMSKNLGEEQACAAAADTIREIRNVLDGEFVLHQPFRGLDFIPVEPRFARAG